MGQHAALAALADLARRLADADEAGDHHRVAGEGAGLNGGAGSLDLAELHAPFTHQELILRESLGLDDATPVNPSGGALTANVVMAAGLVRIGEAANRIFDGSAGRALAHATSGPCLQQNLVCVLEGRS